MVREVWNQESSVYTQREREREKGERERATDHSGYFTNVCTNITENVDVWKINYK